MKKHLCFLATLILISAELVSQNAYYDVLKLQMSNSITSNGNIIITAANKETVIPILGRYMGKPSASFNEIQTYYNSFEGTDNNPFIEIEGTGQSMGFDADDKFGGKPGSPLSAIGGLDVTSLAIGLADFLVKRTKEELNVAFFTRFRETLNSPEYADLKIMFPNTRELFDVLGNEIYNYNRYLQNLREAFLSDLVILDENLPGIIPNHEEFFNAHFGMSAGLNTACYITKSLKNQVHPGDIIDQYPLDKFFRKKGETGYFDENWSGAIQTLQLISESFRDTSSMEDNYWVNFHKIRELINNRPVFKIYLGLIFQVAKNERYDSIQYARGSFIGLLNSVNYDLDYPAYKSYISNFALKANDLNELIKNYSKPGNDSLKYEKYARCFTSTVNLIEHCTKVSTLPHAEMIYNINLNGELKKYFKISYETSDLATDIYRRNYSSAINHAITIYNLIRTKHLETDFADLSRRGASGENVPLNSLKNLEDSLHLSKDLLQKLMRYGTFISTVAAAKNPGEVEQAIEAAALPSGSSRIKRETPFNVSLNAYTGLFAGYERISGMNNEKFEINNYGVAAPVGMAISTGAHHWSWSAFISLLDLGAVASFRFQNSDSIAQIPTIKLQDIFSPGLFFSIGLPKCPLSVNLGAQVGPNLRKVFVEDKNHPGEYINGYQNNVYWRFSASLVVDIPIFNLYTKSNQ